jgi:hypothetical protein
MTRGAPLDPATSDAGVADSEVADIGSDLRIAAGVADQESVEALVSPLVSTTSSVTQTNTVAAEVVPAALQPAANPVDVVSRVVSGLLAWVGLGPSLTAAPSTPVEPPLLWGLLEWARRQVQHILFNRTPTVDYNPAENSKSVDGVITGDLNAVDADGDPLSFTVTQAPQNGSVVINPDGTFTYTPSAVLALTGGTDVFTVKVEDEGAHFHGLLGFLQPDSGHSTAATVAVTVEPISNVVIDTIDVGDGPIDVAVSPDGATAYVTNFDDDTMSVIRL